LNSTLPRTKKSQDTAKRSTSDSNMNHRGAPPGKIKLDCIIVCLLPSCVHCLFTWLYIKIKVLA